MHESCLALGNSNIVYSLSTAVLINNHLRWCKSRIRIKSLCSLNKVIDIHWSCLHSTLHGKWCHIVFKISNMGKLCPSWIFGSRSYSLGNLLKGGSLPVPHTFGLIKFILPFLCQYRIFRTCSSDRGLLLQRRRIIMNPNRKYKLTLITRWGNNKIKKIRSIIRREKSILFQRHLFSKITVGIKGVLTSSIN